MIKKIGTNKIKYLDRLKKKEEYGYKLGTDWLDFDNRGRKQK